MVLALWPLLAVPGGGAFAPLTGIAAALTAVASLPRLRPRIYIGVVAAFFVLAAASVSWSPHSLPLLDLSAGAAVSEVPRIGLLVLAAGAIIAATNVLDAGRARLVGRVALAAFLVQIVIVVVLTLFERQAIAFFYPGKPDDEGVQNISRNCLYMAAAFPFVAMGLSEMRNRVLGLALAVLVFAAESAVLLYREVHAGLLAIAAAAVCYGIIRLAPRHGFRIIGALAALAILSAPFVFHWISAGMTGSAAATSAQYRQAIWARVLEIIQEQPLIGHGVGALRTYRETIPAGEFEGQLLIPNHPHNMALQLWAEMGLAGAALLSLAIVLAAFRLPRPADLGPVAPRIAMLAGVTLAIGVVSFDLWNPGWWGAVALLSILCAVEARKHFGVKG